MRRCCTNSSSYGSYCLFILLLYSIASSTLTTIIATTTAASTAAVSSKKRRLLASSSKVNGAQINIWNEDGDNDIFNGDDGNYNDIKEKEICNYIRRMLSERIVHVLNGERGDAFARNHKRKNSGGGGGDDDKDNGHTKHRDCDAKCEVIDSGSGANGIIFIDQETNNDKRWRKKKGTTIFPTDIDSLELTLPTHIYNLATKEINLRCKMEKNNDRHSFSSGLLYGPRVLFRAGQLGLYFTPVLSTVGLAAISSWYRNKIWYNLVGTCIARCGPAFIKWGQWASTRSDMFPDGLCAALSKLHADAPAHSWRITERTVEQALCIPRGHLHDVFESFSKKPIASGSIAQVHRATILRNCHQHNGKYNNEEDDDDEAAVVALKVRHPNVSRLIEMDFTIMKALAKVLDRIPGLSWLHLRDSMEQFSYTMAAQADLGVEAHNLELLNFNFRKWDHIDFPKPFFACPSVIVETFENGKICTDIIDGYDHVAEKEDATVNLVGGADNAGGGGKMKRGHEVMPTALSKFIVTEGLGLYLKMLIVDNLMHADLHPGNIMLDCFLCGDDDHPNDGLITIPRVGIEDVPNGGGGGEKNAVQSTQRDEKKHQKVKNRRRYLAEVYGGFYGHITLVDAGMVTRLDDEQSANFIGLMSSLGEGDGRSAARCVLRFSSSSSSEETNSDDGGGCSPCDWDDDNDGLDNEDGNGLTLGERDAFITDMEHFFHENCRGYGTNVDVGETLRGVLSLVKKHRVRIDPNYATLVVNALCVDSLAKRVCPTYNVVDAAKPLLRSHYKLCYDKNGGKAICHRSKIRRYAIKVLAPALFLQKKAFDNNFFRRIEMARRHRRRKNQGIRGGGGGECGVRKKGGFSPSFILGLASGIACCLQQHQTSQH